MSVRGSRGMILAVGLAVALSGCRGKEPGTPGASPSPKAPASPPKPSLDEVRKALAEATERERGKFSGMSFEEFKKSEAVFKEPFEGGKYVVDGDTAIGSEKQLKDFFDTRVKMSPGELIVARIGGLDAVWNDQVKARLSYCVSRAGFGPRYDAVVREMDAATAAWEEVAAIDFVHLTAEDGQCTASNAAVVFDVRSVDVGGEYLARAFFPNEPRGERNVLIDESALSLASGDKPQLDGILRHELGHALGFRHEHTRPSSGACFEDSSWTVLTAYDPFSVMHYPQCNGQGDWSLTLTDRDKNGVACLYGAKPGFAIQPALVDVSKCKTGAPVPAPGAAKTETFGPRSVAERAQVEHGPFAVSPGSLFEAAMTGGGAGSGDPDLYVRFEAKPTVTFYDCRPYLVGPDETCAVNVPAGKTQAFVMVRGYTAGKYALKVTYIAPAP